MSETNREMNTRATTQDLIYDELRNIHGTLAGIYANPSEQAKLIPHLEKIGKHIVDHLSSIDERLCEANGLLYEKKLKPKQQENLENVALIKRLKQKENLEEKNITGYDENEKPHYQAELGFDLRILDLFSHYSMSSTSTSSFTIIPISKGKIVSFRPPYILTIRIRSIICSRH